MKLVFNSCRVFLMLVLLCRGALAQTTDPKYAIIPLPVKLTAQAGYFSWNKATKVSVDAQATDFGAAQRELKAISAKCGSTGLVDNKVSLKLDKTISNSEGYRLSIKRTGIVISAASAQGAFWAISSLKQLMGIHIIGKKLNKVINVPCVEIEDAPRFSWRGMHLDVSRHFFDIPYLKTMIDRMAYYKFNKFHLHLTDDEGWRIEIKKYPELTSKGAWREMDGHDSTCITLAKDNPDFIIPEKHFKTINGKRMYGGFYTQEEMKDLIHYAANRSIEIVPEIDMPGHMMAAANLMPWLTGNGKGGKGKGFSEPICPCNERTYEFAENVFSEIAALFPSKYIHLGADEVEKSSWKNVPACEELMKREGLKSVDELQSYFVRRMEKFFNSKGKKLIGWDEILEGGVTPTATMMYWRAWVPQAPKHAAEKGNDVIMTPGEYCYFDAKPDAGTLQKVYSFDPYNYNLTEAEKKYIIGVQANIWTEYIPTERRLENMVFPRMLALAEVAWNKGTANWPGFEQRVQRQFAVLDAMNINYRLPDLEGFTSESVFVDKAVLHINKPMDGLTIRYTSDGTLPTVHSNLFKEDMVITKPIQIKVAAFRPNGNIGDVYTINYIQESYAKPVALPSQEKGLKFSYYEHFYKSVKDIAAKDLTKQSVSAAIDIPVSKTAPSFATKHEGYFYAAETGIYSFALRSDDGSMLKIGNKVVVDNDGLHSSIEKSGQIALEKGYHPFELLFIEGGGGYTLKLQCKAPNGVLRDVVAADFCH